MIGLGRFNNARTNDMLAVADAFRTWPLTSIVPAMANVRRAIAARARAYAALRWALPVPRPIATIATRKRQGTPTAPAIARMVKAAGQVRASITALFPATLTGVSYLAILAVPRVSQARTV